MWIKTHCVRVVFVSSVGPHDAVVEIVLSVVILIALKSMADERGSRPRHDLSLIHI